MRQNSSEVQGVQDANAGSQRILVAGMPRSGSTWLYNCIRLVLATKFADVYACWIKDYDVANSCRIHVIKIHDPDDQPSRVDQVFTSRRDIRDVAGSLIRMGWSAPGPAFLQQLDDYVEKYHAYWVSKALLEIEFPDIKARPLWLIESVASALGVQLDASQVDAVSAALAKLLPRSSYDAGTLLHPNHISDPAANPVHLLGPERFAVLSARYQQWLKFYGYI